MKKKNDRKYNWLFKLTAVNLKYFVGAVLLLLVNAFSMLYQPKVITNIIDVAIIYLDKNYLAMNICCLAILFLITDSTQFLVNYFFSKLIYKVFYELRLQVSTKIFAYTAEQIEKESIKFITCITDDIDNLEMIFSRLIPNVIVGLTQFVIGVFIIGKINLIFIAILLLTYPIMVIIQISLNKQYSVLSRDIMDNKDKSNNLINELVNFMYEYVAMNLEKYFQMRYAPVQALLRKKSENFNIIGSYNTFFLDLSFSIVQLLLIGGGAYGVIINKITIGQLLILMMYFSFLFKPLSSIVNLMSKIPKCKISVERINSMLKEESNENTI